MSGIRADKGFGSVLPGRPDRDAGADHDLAPGQPIPTQPGATLEPTGPMARSEPRRRTGPFVDLLCGLFSLPTADAPPGADYAVTIEERYARPRRCC